MRGCCQDKTLSLLAYSITTSQIHPWRSVLLSVLARWQLPQKRLSPSQVTGWPLFLTLTFMCLSPTQSMMWGRAVVLSHSRYRGARSSIVRAESCLQLAQLHLLIRSKEPAASQRDANHSIPPATNQGIWCVLATSAPEPMGAPFHKI